MDLLILFAVAMAVSAVGWKYFVYFFSLGYGYGIAALAVAMAEQMLRAYIGLFATAQDIDRAVKNERNSAYVEGLINDGPTYRAVSKMIGPEDAKTLFRRCLFGTSGIVRTDNLCRN